MEESLRRFLAGPPARTARFKRTLLLAVPGFALVSLGAWFAARGPGTQALRFEHNFLLVRDGKDQVLEAGLDIRTGDLLSLSVHTDEPTFLYLFDEDDAGNRHVLFPPSRAQNPLTAGDHVLPGPKHNHWVVDQPGGGEEHIYLLASREPVSFAERLCELLPSPSAARQDRADPSPDLEGDLRGVGAMERPVSDEPRSLSSYFDWLERGARPSPDLVFRRLDLRNP